MHKRFLTIWFRQLTTDWFIRRNPSLGTIPFVLVAPDHGRMVITAANGSAQTQGIERGMVVADARAITSLLEVLDDKPELPAKLLKGIAEWCIRYSPVVAVDMPDGLIMEITGCTHLWGGEKQYLTDMLTRIQSFGYHVRGAIADTIGTAWALVRYSRGPLIVESDKQEEAIAALPPASLRIESETAALLEKLGLRQVKDFMNMPRSTLRRRFGTQLLLRLGQALGYEEEGIISVQPIEPYQQRLPCLEAIVTAGGIEFALKKLLDELCYRLQHEQKGLRIAVFKGYRVDGKIESLRIETIRPSCNPKHLFKLFEIKIETIEPALGIELFTLDALKVEDLSTKQQALWNNKGGLDDTELSELLDRIGTKLGNDCIHRYVPDEHYWPERSFKKAADLNEKSPTTWRTDKPRPLQMLNRPELIEVTAPIPDYPPMLFRYKGKLHKVAKADGPERIEQEWWLQQGQHRDYYTVEDEEGHRYWLFRSGHYDATVPVQWFIHGFFA
jgi:protein ImuB